MRIVHVTNWYVPGWGYQENHLPAQQAASGNEVTIVTADRLPPYATYVSTRGSQPPSRRLPRGRTRDGSVDVIRLRTLVDGRGTAQVILAGLAHLLRELRPDVVHAHNAFSPTTLQSVYLSERIGYRVFVDDHTHRTNFSPQGSWARRAYVGATRAFYGRYGRLVKRFLPVTPAAAAILETSLDVPRARMSMLHLGADARRFRPDPRLRRESRKELGIAPTDVAVVTAGKFGAEKKVDLLVAAMEELHENIHLFLVGGSTPEYRARLEDMISKKRLADRVHFQPFAPNVTLPRLFNGADIGAWPGAHTITALEAACCGLPIVLPSSEEAYRPLFERQAAFPVDNASLGQALGQLAADAGMRRELGERARFAFETDLSWERIAEESLRIYEAFR